MLFGDEVSLMADEFMMRVMMREFVLMTVWILFLGLCFISRCDMKMMVKCVWVLAWQFFLQLEGDEGKMMVAREIEGEAIFQHHSFGQQ